MGGDILIFNGMLGMKHTYICGVFWEHCPKHFQSGLLSFTNKCSYDLHLKNPSDNPGVTEYSGQARIKKYLQRKRLQLFYRFKSRL